MKKLIGLKKIKTAVFISGRGTNLKNLIKFSKKKNSPILINLIISNKKMATGLKYAKKYNIEKKVINFKNERIAERKIFYLLDKTNTFWSLFSSGTNLRTDYQLQALFVDWTERVGLAR